MDDYDANGVWKVIELALACVNPSSNRRPTMPHVVMELNECLAFELKVTCILPPIPHDPEDDVSMEDEHSDELESVKDISKKGYKFKADDWKNRSVDTLDTLDALIHMTIHMTENVETSQASASIEDDSENTKLNKIIELMMENAKSMKDRMSLLEAENMELRACVSELEGNQNVAPHTQTPVFPTNVTQQRSSGTPLSPMSQQPETPSLQTQEFSPNLPRESGREPLNETTSLQTQELSPNLTPENDPKRSYETPSNANEKENLSDEDATEPATVIIETQVCTPVLTQQVGTEAMNETPVSPIAPQSIEIPVFTPIQTQQVGTEAMNERPVSPIAPQSIETPFFTPIQTQQEDTHDVHNTPSSPVSSLISRKDIIFRQSSSLSTLFENGADVEIATSVDATCRIWYPGNVFATNLCDGVEKVAVTLFADQKRVTATADKIRPKPPADDREKKFEMMDNVEAFYSKGWSSGQVRMILGENTFSVYLNSSMETLEFKASDLRIHREWLDGVWKMADETPLHEANPDQTASRQNEANPDQTQQDTKEPMNETISQNISDTHRLTRARAKILREQNKTDILNGVGMLKVEYSTRFRDKEKKTKKLQESVFIHSIRPQPPPGDTKGFELMDKVEAYHNDGWCSGEVHIILSNDIYSVRFNSSTEFIKFNFSDLRIPKEWVDGVWKMEKEIEVQQTQSVKPRQDDHAKKGKPVVGMKRKTTAHPVDHAKKGKPVVGMKRKATAQPVDRLAFLQREKKRPIVPRNPPMPVTPEVILPIDPFVTPEFPLFSRLGYWMQLCGIHYVEQSIPKACFVPVQFLETVGYCYENLQKPDKKGINILKGWVGEVVRGLIRPNKMWMQDVDIVYGVVHERLVDHFIGVEIHLMENTITIFHCGVHKVKENPLIQKLAVLIPAIKLEMMNEEINFNDIVPFQVKMAEGLPKTKLPFNCGLFVVKMLECRSLRLKKKSSINDDTAMDLRSKLCCEMFDQFMDKDFQEGCRR
ncbi:hypothetical protein Bca4012_098125 [Brassica carinata]